MGRVMGAIALRKMEEDRAASRHDLSTFLRPAQAFKLSTLMRYSLLNSIVMRKFDKALQKSKKSMVLAKIHYRELMMS